MKIIGLTGGIATGKSTVSKMFRDANIPLIDTDLIAREILNKGTTGYHEVVGEFSEDILFSDKEINRKKLGKIIFTNNKKRKVLNNIVHPKVKQIVLEEIERYRRNGSQLVIVDVPLLYESGFDELVDDVIVVYTSEELQLERLIDREQITEEYALMKIRAQMPLNEKVNRAKYIIDNSASILETKKQFNLMLEEIEVE